MPINTNSSDYDLDYINDHEVCINNIIKDTFPTTTFIFSVVEKNKNDMLHFHLLIGIRNLIDYNYIIRDNLLYFLKINLDLTSFSMSEFDIKVEPLRYFRDIKNWAIYMYKDMYLWDYPANIHIIKQFKQDPFIDNLGNVTWLFLNINVKFHDLNIVFDSYKEIDSLKGIKLKDNDLNQNTIIYLLQYYLILNNYFIHKNEIYEKIENSLISYRLVGGIIDILYDKFQENVVMFYTVNFGSYFTGFDFNYLWVTYINKIKSVVESMNRISTQRIMLDFSLMEFTDGVYSIKYDRFFPRRENSTFNNISTIKYYNQSYNWVRQNKPKIWINGLNNALNVNNVVNYDIENDESFKKICLYLINIIHKDIFDKKSTLFIYGESNTGKTTLIVNLIMEFFGQENVGSIVSARNFKWQDLINKLVGIVDEGRYNSSMSSDLLKLTGQEKIIVERKYSKEHTKIDPIPLFILSNILFTDKNLSVNEALKSRMFIVEFINKISIKNQNPKLFKENLKTEEPNIIIYCNKLLFSLYKHKNLSGRVSNNEIIKRIESK